MHSVLIVEDERLVAESVSRSPVWAKCGFSVRGIASNGIEAVSMLKETAPDVAFVDIKMPGMNGLEVMTEAKQRGLPTLFVILSGHAEFAYAQRAMRCGAVDYCLKPLDPFELESILKKIGRMLLEGRPEPPAESLQSQAAPAVSPLVQKALDHLEEHFAEAVTLSALARQLHVSVNHLCAVFRRDTGKTVNEHLTSLRMRQARELLADPELQVGEVAARCGYDNLFYFSRLFKKLTGKTPSEFRRE